MTTPAIKRTSSMVYPLEEPEGWFLLKMEHQHTAVIYKGDEHVPLPHAKGSWYVEFQKYPRGGNMISGRGRTMREAWNDALENIEAYELYKGTIE